MARDLGHHRQGWLVPRATMSNVESRLVCRRAGPELQWRKSTKDASADKHRLRCLGFFECRHNLFREPIELLQGNFLRHADREAYRDAIEPWVFLLERLEVLDQVIRITAQEAAGLDRILDARQLGGGRTLGITHDLYL